MRLYAENNTNYVKSTDTGSVIKLQVIGNDNSPMDLTIFDIVNVVIGNDGKLLVINPISVDAQGFIEFKIPSSSLPYGRYFLEVNMTKSNKELLIAPSDRQFTITLTKSLNELTGDTITIVNLQQLLTDIEYAKDNSDIAILDALTALNQSNTALVTSDQANTNSSTALTASQTAETNSTNALITANDANTKSDTALSNSITALTNSTEALSTANTSLTNSSEALSTSNTALTTANTAMTDSTSALANSQTAVTDSSNALTIANEAKTASTTAESNSTSALTTANTADTNASTALTNSNTAITTANEAKSTADQVRSEFDQIISGNTDAEVINARTNASGTTFTTVKSRLDDSDSKLAQTNTSLSNLQTSLANVDNTSDLNKPISTATQSALDLKANQLDLQKLVNEGFLNSYATSQDANGYYTIVTFKRNDTTIYLVSTLSNSDSNGYYQTCTWDFYDVDGTTITSTRTWTFTYDANGKIITKEVV